MEIVKSFKSLNGRLFEDEITALNEDFSYEIQQYMIHRGLSNNNNSTQVAHCIRNSRIGLQEIFKKYERKFSNISRREKMAKKKQELTQTNPEKS